MHAFLKRKKGMTVYTVIFPVRDDKVVNFYPLNMR